jgi:intein/homing endonuclease
MHDGSDDDDDENADNLYVDVAAPGLLPSTTSTTSVQDYNITADLDIEEDDNFEDAEEEIDISSVMALYLLAIQKRIRKELHDKNMSSEDKWLHKFLKDDEYWIEVKRVKSICKKLSLKFSEQYYYRDVRVWFPEIEFG